MKSLQVEAIKALYKDTSYEDRLRDIDALCQDIPFNIFFNSNFIISKLKGEIIKRVKKLDVSLVNSELDRSAILYLIEYDDTLSYIDLIFMLDVHDFECSLSFYPSMWSKYIMKNDLMIISVNSSCATDEFKETARPLDIQKDIIDKKIPSSKIRLIWINYSVSEIIDNLPLIGWLNSF